jgi:tetraacyldisaccharide 4'-kinase
MLLDKASCDVILSDDGLQHYALDRDIEVIVIDGQRRFGNNYFLPAGPLREPTSRLQEVDLVICNGEAYEENEYSMQVQGDQAVNLVTHEQCELSKFSNTSCHAIAGIGNPQRFFDLLENAQINIKPHRFPDHHQFTVDEIVFNDVKTVLMTEKDAVKCKAFATEKHWYVPVEAKPEELFTKQLLALLALKKTHK